MKIISTKAHGIIDYIVGVLFIAMPWILNLNKYGNESFAFIGVGGFTLIISVLTRYELGVLKRISMRNHLILDAISGIFLATSPWLLGFDERIYLPYLFFGAMELLVVLLSESRSLRDDKFLDVGEVYHVATQTAEEGIRKKDND